MRQTMNQLLSRATVGLEKLPYTIVKRLQNICGAIQQNTSSLPKTYIHTATIY